MCRKCPDGVPYVKSDFSGDIKNKNKFIFSYKLKLINKKDVFKAVKMKHVNFLIF